MLKGMHTRMAVTGVALVTVASCSGGQAAGTHHRARPAPGRAAAGTVMVRAGRNAVALVPVSPASLGCPQTARGLRYPVPCPAMLPRAVLQAYSCGATFMAANPCHSRPWHGWMAASGGTDTTGQGVTPSNTEHFVMESVPYRTINYDVVANGPVWKSLGRPRTVRLLGWITISGQRMRWIIVPQNTQGSAMAGHLMLVWSTRSHTYALGFHNLYGMRLAKALDVAVARHLSMVLPGRELTASLSATDVPCGDARSGRKIGGGCCPLTPSEP